MMYYLSDTEESALAYNAKVNSVRNFGDVTTNWANPVYFNAIEKWGIQAFGGIENEDIEAELQQNSSEWILSEQ